MANAFDQFDAPAAPASGGNAFDQFDNPQSAAPSAAASLVPPVPSDLPSGLSEADYGRGGWSLAFHHPGIILGNALKEGGDLARGAVTDAVDTLTGFPSSGGNLLKAAQNNPLDPTQDHELPADKVIDSIAKTNPKTAVLANVAQGAAGAAPLAAFGGLPSIIQKAAALGFSAQMISGVKDTATQLGEEMGKPVEQQDSGKIARLKSDLVQTGVFAPLAAAGGAGKFVSDRLKPSTPTPDASKIQIPISVLGDKQAINPKTVAEGSATEVQKPAEEKAVAPNATQAPKPPEILPADQSVSQPAGQADTGDKTTQAATPTFQPAIKYKGQVLTGGGNGHIGIVMSHADEFPNLPSDFMGDANGMSGFVDENGTFHTRQEAADVLGSKTPMTSEDLPTFDKDATPAAKKVIPFMPKSGVELGKSIGAKFDGEFDLGTGPIKQFTYAGKNFQGDENTPHYGTTFQMPADATLEQAKAKAQEVKDRFSNQGSYSLKSESGKFHILNPKGKVEESFTDPNEAIKALGEYNTPSPEVRAPEKSPGTGLPMENTESYGQRFAREAMEAKEKSEADFKAAQLRGKVNPAESLTQVVNRLGRQKVSELLGEWEDGAQLSEDGKSVKAYTDPRNRTGFKRVPHTDFLNWISEKEKQSPANRLGVAENTKNAPGTPRDMAPAQSSQKFRVGNSPQLHLLVEKLPASDVEIANGEQPVRVKNEKTGDIQTVMESDLTPVTERPAADKLAQASAAKKLDDQLRALNLDPKSFPNVASKRAALKRQKALAIGVGPGAATATGGEFSMPTIEDQLGGGPLAPKRENAPQPTIEPQNKTTINSLSDAVKNAVDATKGFIGGLAGKTFPKTTLISKRLGELGARWTWAKIAARPKAELFVAEVLGDSGLKSRDVGAALTEDNLRSIKKAYLDKGDTESAEKVQTLIGKKGSPFKTEEDYQNFLNDPKFKEVVERHRDMWKSTVEPQYRAAMRIDPETELPSRGLQTGARINLRAVREGENPSNVVRTTARGNLLNTLRKKSPFGIQATGTGEAYHTDLHDLMENTFGKQDEIAAKNEFEKALVESGNAVEDKPGQDVNIAGRPAVQFPLTRKTIMADGKPVAVNRSLYVNPKIASEYRIGANVDWTPPNGIFSKIASFINQSAIASATEATTHVMNLGSALFALPATSGKILNDAFLTSFGRADIPVKVVQTIMKSMKDNRAQIAGLSEIGAMRSYHEPTKIPLMRQASQMIQWMDKNTRLVLDDAYQRMRDQGLVDPSETARREFVNQVGQYNQRAQPYLMVQMRKLGISPFVTAGKNFNTLGIREATFNPGVKATSVPAALALRANMLSKWVGTAALLMSVNYLLTKSKGGGVSGRPGTPLGYIDTGEKDKNGRNVLINLLGITGQGRALRVTGIKGFVDAERMGLGAHNGVDSAARDMINAAVSPWAGPLPRFAVGAATGYPIAANVGRAFPVVPPGTSQHLSDFKNAVIQMNPVVAGIHQAMQPNSSGWIDAVRSQFPRLVPQSGRSDSMTKNYPEIVQKAQANEFINYVVHAARTVPIAHRRQFVNEQIKRLPAELQPKAQQEMNYRKVFSDN